MQTAHPVAGAMNDANRITTKFDALGAAERAPNGALQKLFSAEQSEHVTTHPVRGVVPLRKQRRFVDERPRGGVK
jgi:hypothetical protein